MRRIWPLLLALLPALAAAQTEIVPGYADRPARGPAAAAGIVIWNHGLGRLKESTSDTPFLLDGLADAGWDVVRLHRRWASDRVEDSSAALIAAAQGFKSQGYRRVISAGQSFGGWISFAAAGRTRGLFDAIIATAPAAHGEVGRSSNYELNASHLYDMASDLNPTRVLVVFFERDSYDPGGRGPRLARILSQAGMPFAVIDRPAGFAGHSVGQSLGFARVFGPCILAFVAEARLPGAFPCQAADPAPLSTDFALPKALSIAAPDSVAPELRPFLGRWFGWYDNGRQLQLIVTGGTPDKVTAIYATTAQYRQPKAGGSHAGRSGTIDAGGTLSFAEGERSRLSYRPRADGRLEATWTRADGSGTLTTTLRRLAP